MKTISNYINGEKTNFSQNYLNVDDPSTGEIISKVVLSNDQDFNKVIESSKNSLSEWSNTTPLKRSRIISNYKNLIEL